MNKDKLLIIIPTYNEEKNIGRLLEQLITHYPMATILVIDDHSQDSTPKEILKWQQRTNGEQITCLNPSFKAGLGSAYLYGFRWAQKKDFDYIVQMDSDFSHRPEDIHQLLRQCQKPNVDVALGSRYLKGVSFKDRGLTRILLSLVANFYAKLWTGLRQKDLTGGFRCYNKKAFQSLKLDDLHTHGHVFQVEVLYHLTKQGLNICEVPIVFCDRRQGRSKLNLSIFVEGFFAIPKFSRKKKVFKQNPQAS